MPNFKSKLATVIPVIDSEVAQTRGAKAGIYANLIHNLLYIFDHFS